MNTEHWTPEWARTVVWYQIFPERFHNGDANNDPSLADLSGAWPHDLNEPWQVHPWTSDWYEQQPYEQAHADKDIWFHLQRRRYGGDIQGIIDKLDYLQDLGITALYLNPVFAAPSSHKYDGATYHHIDPNLGPDPAGDRARIAQENPSDSATWTWTAADRLMLELIKEVHRRRMYIIFDGVFNHVGLNFWAFRDVVQNQKRSPYKDWFKITSWDEPAKGKRFKYQGWFGVRELPEWQQDKNGIVDGPRRYIFECTRRWQDPLGNGDVSAGIDGWRLDVAFCVAHPFWKAWRTLVKTINPQAYLTAEVIDPIPVLHPYLQGDEFDAVMNYNFAFACAEHFINRKRRISTTEFDRALRTLREAFPAAVAPVMQNLYNSHDSPRLATLIANPDQVPYRQWSRYVEWSHASNAEYHWQPPTAEERQTQKLMVLFQMTYVGAPMIYYGDEAGMYGANDPCCRKPMLWPEQTYAPLRHAPDGSVLAEAIPTAFDHDLYSHYQRLIRLRASMPVLQYGDFATVAIDDRKQLYAFRRSLAGEELLVAINSSDSPQTWAFDGSEKTVDVLDGHYTAGAVDGKTVVTIPPRWARLLKKI